MNFGCSDLRVTKGKDFPSFISAAVNFRDPERAGEQLHFLDLEIAV